MENEDTIVAIATANGIGSISIVRLSGKQSYDIALNISKKISLNDRFATLSKLYNLNNELIDEAIIIYFKNPHSFTAEDIVEFQCHGGTVVCEIIIDTCIQYGARLANPGEFSKRAFLNNKIDLSQANAICKIIEAKSQDAVKLLARQLKGDLSLFVNNIRDDLLSMLAHTEVSIDYAEEDLPNDIYSQIKGKLSLIKEKLKEILEVSKRREGLLDGFKIAIIGKPNVGKSSLLNKLLNYDRAIVSDIAGTTRDTIEENIKIGTHIIKIIDTAGIRQSYDKIEQTGINRSKDAIKDANIVIALFDRSKQYSVEDEQIIDYLKRYNKNHITLLTKSDLKEKFSFPKSLRQQFDPIEINTKKDINLLIDEIKRILDKDSSCNDTVLVSKQQILHIEETLENINLSFAPLGTGELEFFSYYINEAIKNISNITRPYEHSQMLDIMFGEFCLGK